jgi:outer membrane protein TolC
MSRYLIILFFLTSTLCVGAAELRLDRQAFVREALRVDPRMREERMAREAKVLQVSAIKAGALLPKFEVSMLMGPAPGLKTSVENGDTVETWDFTKLGPFLGADFSIAQPLNYGQLETGLKAARADLRQKEMDIANKELRKSVELQEYYYGYLLALELKKLVLDAQAQLRKAQEKMETALEDEDEGVSQQDVLEIKAGFFEVDKGVADAEMGLRKVRLATRFALGLDDSTFFVPAESALTARGDAVPSLDSLKSLARHLNPDLRRLQAGLEGMDMQMELAAAKLGPEFFIMGQFTYAKSWAGDRTSINSDAFAQDPVNTISGALGLGVKYKLNLWSTWENYKKVRAEYRVLKHKESYAFEGTDLLVEEKYLEWENCRDKYESVRRSLQATEGILKGVALQYEIDPSRSDALVSAYKKNLYMQKDYYYAVYNYNIAIANLYAQVGLPADGLVTISTDNPPRN